MSSLSVNPTENRSAPILAFDRNPESLISKIGKVAKEVFLEAVYWGKLVVGAVIVITLVKAVLFYPITAIALGVLGVVIYKNKDAIAGKIEFHFNMLKNTLKIEPWFKEIKDRQVVVGKVPLENKGHAEQLKKMGVAEVVALVEEQDLDKKHLLARLVTPLIWQEKEVGFTKIIINHSKPLSIETLDKAVAVMDSVKKKGAKSYVYSSGKSSVSGMITAAYLMKSHGVPLQEARQIIENQKLSMNFDLQELGRLVEYDGYIRNNK